MLRLLCLKIVHDLQMLCFSGISCLALEFEPGAAYSTALRLSQDIYHRSYILLKYCHAHIKFRGAHSPVSLKLYRGTFFEWSQTEIRQSVFLTVLAHTNIGHSKSTRWALHVVRLFCLKMTQKQVYVLWLPVLLALLKLHIGFSVLSFFYIKIYHQTHMFCFFISPSLKLG